MVKENVTTIRRVRVAIARLSLADRLAILFRGWAIVYLSNAKAHTEAHVAGRLPSDRNERVSVAKALATLRKAAKDAATQAKTRERRMVAEQKTAMSEKGDPRDQARGGDRGDDRVGNPPCVRDAIPLSGMREVARGPRAPGRDGAGAGTVGRPAAPVSMDGSWNEAVAAGKAARGD
jgi:hypothetical protein